MGYKTDIEIAQECTMEPITRIAEKAGIEEKYLEQYGKYKAKIDYNLMPPTASWFSSPPSIPHRQAKARPPQRSDWQMPCRKSGKM